jgi:DNA-binding protein H-NS
MSIAELMKSIDVSDDSARRTTSATSHSSSSLDAFEGALVTWNLMGRMGRALNVPGPNDARTTLLAPSFLEDPLQRCQDSLATQHELGKRLALIESQMASLRLESERLRAEATVAAANLIEVLRNAYPQDASEAKLTACAPIEPQLAIGLVPEDTDSHPKTSSRYVGPSGEVWLGKGRYPKWLKAALSEGRQLSDFAALA